jgi:creatinine amidohydrolase
MARDGESVREEVRASLPPVEVDLVGEIQRGAIHFVDIGIAQAYCGDPAHASAAEGRETVEKLASAVVEGVRATWPELFA